MQIINNQKDKNEAFRLISANEDPGNILSIAKYLKQAFNASRLDNSYPYQLSKISSSV